MRRLARIARITRPAHVRTLGGDIRGATVVELGFVMLPFTVILLALFDFGHRMYLGAIVEGTLHRAARLSTVGDRTTTQIDDYVKSQLKGFSRNATIEINKKSFFEYDGVGKAEKITQDTAPVGSYNVGDCYEDLNNNRVYDRSAGKTGLGGSDDIVYYEVKATFPRIVPLNKFLGWDPTETVSSNMVLRNQPFAAQTIPSIRCN